ncbi:MAG: hypothetical protein NW216_13640 [Hyphomicrobium sp.]|nr:hypothetical protein [Hyphomicrobium sp.]
MTPVTTILTARLAFAAVLSVGALGGASTEAGAVSMAVKMACAGDYFSYCSQHKPDSPGVRQCMRSHGLQLSKRCVTALIGAGEVSAEEVARRAAQK